MPFGGRDIQMERNITFIEGLNYMHRLFFQVYYAFQSSIQSGTRSWSTCRYFCTEHKHKLKDIAFYHLEVWNLIVIYNNSTNGNVMIKQRNGWYVNYVASHWIQVVCENWENFFIESV